MQTAFHHEDVPPQNWLDELHGFNIPRSWDVQLEDKQRSNLAKRAQDQLNAWRVSIRDQMKKIDGRYDTSNKDSLEKILLPYQTLDNLGNDLHAQIRDLREKIKGGRAIPQGFEFGTRIFGDMETKRWQLGDREDEQRWRDFMSIERRYQTLGKEYKAQSRGYDNAKQRVSESQDDLEILNAIYKQRRGFLQIGVRLFIVMLTIVFCLIVGALALFVDFPDGARINNEILSAIMLIMAVIGAIAAVMLARRRRETIAVLETDIEDMTEALKTLNQETLRQRQYLLPTQQTLKEVRANYQVLKETF